MNDLIYLVLNTVVILSNACPYIHMSMEWQRTLSTFAIVFLWFKVFDWLRLFDNTAFFVLLVVETAWSIRHFMMILVVWYMMFGSAFYILNMNSETDEEEILPHISGFWVFDAFMGQYELSLGEFMSDGYRATEGNRFLVYLLFFASTFLIQIMFLNMLIAIMGDAFDHATEETDNNARMTKLQIMGDYIHLINTDNIDYDEDPNTDSHDGS